MSALSLAIAAASAAAAPLEQVAAFDPTTSYSAWAVRRNQAENAARTALEAAGAKIHRESSGQITIRFAGIRATSRQGLLAALKNWLRAARAKTEESAHG